ncbi:hypothetical protein ACP3UV_22045 [Mixta calida]
MTNERLNIMAAMYGRLFDGFTPERLAQISAGDLSDVSVREVRMLGGMMLSVMAEKAASQAVQSESDDYRNLKELYHAQEKRLFKLAQSIKGPAFDKYSHTTSQAIDVLESALTAEPVADEEKMLAEQAKAVIHCLDMCEVPEGDYADNPQLKLWGRVIEYGRLPAPVVPDEFFAAEQNEKGMFELSEDCMCRLAEVLKLNAIDNTAQQYVKWFTEFGHLNRGDMLTSEQHRCHNEKKKFQRRV